MNHKTVLFIIGYLFLIVNDSFSQYKSIGFEISTSTFIDDYVDNEFDYDFMSHTGLVQWGLGGSFQIKDRIVIGPKISYTNASMFYLKEQIRSMGGSMVDRTFIQKDQTLNFLKIGVGLSFWADRPGKGLYLEGEFQGFFSLSAKSEEIRLEGGGAIIDNTIDFIETFKGDNFTNTG